MFRLSSPTRRSLVARHLLVPALALVTLAVPTRLFAQAPTFNALVTTDTGSPNYEHPNLAGVGDFNGDGKLDSLISTGSENLRLMLGNGNGTFTQLYVRTPGAGNQSALRVADLNGDGRLDAITASNQGNLAAAVLINTGNDLSGVPQFTVTNYTNPGFGLSGLRSLTIGDLNGGKPDFIVGNAQAGLRVWLNNGDGTFTGGQYYSIQPSAGGPSTGPGVIVDLNGDGKGDFLESSGQAAATNVFLGNGDGTLQAPVVIQLPGRAPGAIAAADLNNDGKPDFVEALSDGSLGVFLNNANGTFSAPVSYQLPPTGNPSDLVYINQTTSVAISDINGDGKLDLVAGYAQQWYASYGVAMFTGNGDGTFGPVTKISMNGPPLDVSVNDFNGDGKPDIARVGYNDNTYGVLLNTTVFVSPAQMFFTDALTGNTSPNLGAIPAGKYGYTPSGLLRTQSSSTTDRPMVTTGLGTYLTASNFTAEVTVTLANVDLLYFGLGRGDSDPTYYNEPANAFYFRVHSGWQGNYSIQADARNSGSSVFVVNQIGSYTLGSTITLRIVRAGDTVTMSVVGGGSVSYNISAFPSLGLTNSNTRVFFGNSTVGSVFSDLAIYEALPDTTAPVIDGPGGLVREATGPGGAEVTFTATAEDDVDGPVAVTANPASGSLFAIGNTTVELSAADAAGNDATASFIVTVEDTTDPAIASVSGDLTAEATSAAGATVSYAAATATDAVGPVSITYSQASGTTFEIGATTVTVTATDAFGNASSAQFVVTVHDTTAPAMGSVTPSQATLWSPNHKMVAINVNASATDAVGVTSLKIIAVTSSEPDNGLGDGDTAGDIVITGALSVNLRAERSGKGNGRTYTITVEARDLAGNASTKTTTVVVPKSQGK